MTARIIALANQKGGSTKTTSCLNLGAALAERGKRVLAVDFDPQASLTVACGLDPDALEHTVYTVLHGLATLRNANGPTLAMADILQPTRAGFMLAPSGPELGVADLELMQTDAGEHVLAEALEPVRDSFDLVLIDCPPTLSILTINALCASDLVLIPVSADYLTMKGVDLLLRTITRVQRRLNRNLRVAGAFFTKVARTTHSRNVVERTSALLTSRGVAVLTASVPYSVKAQDSTVLAASVLSYASTHPVAEAYRRLAEEVLRNAE
ncbi:MAG: ParA family protein, partial [Chloroflexi bacterium]|nr:ParA family protein [Chloroflexota bacterium]